MLAARQQKSTFKASKNGVGEYEQNVLIDTHNRQTFMDASNQVETMGIILIN